DEAVDARMQLLKALGDEDKAVCIEAIDAVKLCRESLRICETKLNELTRSDHCIVRGKAEVALHKAGSGLLTSDRFLDQELCVCIESEDEWLACKAIELVGERGIVSSEAMAGLLIAMISGGIRADFSIEAIGRLARDWPEVTKFVHQSLQCSDH